MALRKIISGLETYGEYAEEVSRIGRRKVYTPSNHLAQALSPYLQEHASDPVGWYEWGAEAFDTAASCDMPLFVHVGYSSSHWCRVMNRDCFADSEVAGMLNASCIPVCVDREERPDIDALLTEACITQNGSAGWPLNVWMTPEGRPFMCVTWLPKRGMGEMPGFTELIPRIKWLWRMQDKDTERGARELTQAVQLKLSGYTRKSRRLPQYIAQEALMDLQSVFDSRWGGFGGVPKFPEPEKMIFLLEQADPNALTMTDITIRRMWRGGIHDHLGGGFSRYAIDERWLVPHFEKLLSTQALLLFVVSKAQSLRPNSFHRLFAEDIIFCAMRYFSDDVSYSQGFRSSIDGDTGTGEGRYYLWTEDEIRAILPAEDAGLFCSAYGVLPSGNFGSEVGGAQMGQNILYEASTVSELAKNYGIKGSEVASRLAECRRILLEARDKRYPLKADSKILMGHNGLMIAALSHAALVFEQSEWRDMAERTALFMQKNLADKSGEWHHMWVNGQAKGRALAEDYAYFLWGVIELYKTVKHFSPNSEKQLSEWMACAQSVADAMISQCFDEQIGGLYLSDRSDLRLFAQVMNAVDNNSLPSPNSIAALALSELGQLSEEKKYSDKAKQIISTFSHYAAEHPTECTSLIIANQLWKPVKKKPIAPPPPPPTDEELNAPVDVPAAATPAPESRASRTSRRSSRTSGEGHAQSGSARSPRRRLRGR